MRPDPDAVVVGAGPAGSIAALTLARAGARVRLVDRAAFPRDKLCGDTVNPGSLALLDRIGIGASVRARGLRTTGMTVTGPGRASVSADYPEGLSGVALRRRHLDLMLLEAAVAAGVEFEPDVHVHDAVIRPGDGRVEGVRLRTGRGMGALRSRVVVVADGRASRLATRLGLTRLAANPRRWAYGAYFTGVDALSSRGEMHVRGDGYIGIAPVGDGLANVCVVQPLACAAGRRPEAVVVDALAADPMLRERFAAAERVGAVAVLGPLAVDADAAGCPGLLLAGDAAGFVDPMTGDGMRFAIRGGELAGLAALRELADGVPAHRGLARERAREFGGKWRLNRALRLLVGSPGALRLAAIIARGWGRPVEYLIGVAGDVSLARHA